MFQHLFCSLFFFLCVGISFPRGKAPEEEALIRTGVLFSFRGDPGSGKIKYTELDACQAYKLLSGLDLSKLLDSVMDEVKAERTKGMWCQLDELNSSLRVPKDHPTYLKPKDFHDKAKLFARNLTWLIKDQSMTPYLHTLVYHVPQFLEMYGTIYQMNCQLVELKNHRHNSIFHRGS